MKTGYRSILLISVLFIFVLFQLPGSVVVKDSPFKSIESLTKSNKDKGGKLIPDVNFGKIPLYFIHNKGQVNKRALFYAKTPGYTLWVTKEGLVFDSMKSPRFASPLTKGGRGGSDRDISRLNFTGANKDTEVTALKPQKLKVNYFKGNDKNKWVGGVPTSGAALYKNLYKNIDLKVYGIGKQIEYDWIVNPGGDPDDIKFEYKNVKKIKINKSGDLDIKTQFGKLTHKKPFAYQDTVGANGDSPGIEIIAHFKLRIDPNEQV